MRHILAVSIVFLVLGVFIGVPLVLAQDQAVPIDPEALLASYAGIVTLTWILVEFAGKWVNFGPDSDKSKKPLAALAVAIILGVISKLCGISFAATKWPVLIGALAYYGLLGTMGINKVLKGLGWQIPNKNEVPAVPAIPPIL